MKFILVTVLLLGGCKSMEDKHPERYTKTTFSPVPIENYDEEILK